jgi:hypothetical protein
MPSWKNLISLPAATHSRSASLTPAATDACVGMQTTSEVNQLVDTIQGKLAGGGHRGGVALNRLN